MLEYRALFPHLNTDPDRYSGTTIIRDQRAVQKLTLNPTSFLGEFFDRAMVLECLVSRP